MTINIKNKLCARPILLLIALTALSTGVCAFAKEQDADLTNLSMEELMNIEVRSTATLTDTKPRLVPAAVTTITSEQIKAAGARSLFELFDIYVPNLQWKHNLWESDNIGLRGIINDRNDKFLLLVNGRIMNDHTHSGVVTELDLPMLNDIHHIDVVRGPGSALYGPGAVSMVINIITFNGKTFQGTEITGRLGAVEEFYTTELKYGKAFDDNETSIFMYAGISQYRGANKSNAPQMFGFDFPSGAQMGWDTYSTPSDGTQAGHPLLNPSVPNDGESFRDQPPIKLQAELTKGDLDIWARFTRGGKQFGWDPGVVTRAPYGWYNWMFLDWTHGSPAYITPTANEYGYYQLTGFVGYKQELNKDIDIDYAFSYEMLDYLRTTGGQGFLNETYREDNYFGRVMVKWQVNDQHKIAFGPEISHNELGLQSPFLNDGNPRTDVLGDMKSWSTNLYSLVGEHQWTISDKWTTFLGARLDDHTYTKPMFSPRAAIVYTPNDKNTYKLMWSRSVRMSYEEAMKANANDPCSNSSGTPPEILDSVELRYERQQSKNLDFAASIFYHYNFEVISYSGGSDAVLGNQKEWGIELESSYHTDKTRLTFSHAYTKLIDFDLKDQTRDTFITAEPHGYGDDLAQWSNHITKLTAEQKLDDKWTLDGSFRIYWGFPGMKDYDQYAHDTSGGRVASLYNGWDTTYRGNYYLNLGLRYKPSNDLTIGVYGYYLLGIFDRDLNKRNTGYSGYRDHAPAISVSLEYKF